MILVVNGLDMLPYLAKGGLRWQRADVDGPNASRLMSGEMQRDRIAIKQRLDITCRPLYTHELTRVLKAIQPEYVSVQYTDPSAGQTVTRTFYSNNIPVTLYGPTGDSELWQGLAFPLIMK